MPRHDEHYAEMKIQPYDVMRQMDCLEAYLLAAAIKYIMRAGRKTDSFQTEIQKAISVLQDYMKEQEVPF